MIEFGLASLGLLPVTGTLPGRRFTNGVVSLKCSQYKTNTDVYLLKIHRDHMNVQLCYLPDN